MKNAEDKSLICILGANGNLGREVRALLEKEGLFEVRRIGWRNDDSNEFMITENGVLTSKSGRVPSVIVNLANSYHPNGSDNQIIEMKNAIVGTASSLSKWIEQNPTRLVFFSSYFQYCPKNLAPWSTYSELKDMARDIQIQACKKVGMPVSEFILLDNYGGLKNRGKFTDVALLKARSGDLLLATEGEQVMNLTHVHDIAEVVVKEIYTWLGEFGSESFHQYAIESKETFSLREIVETINRYSMSPLEVQWGAYPYRPKEVFKIWQLPAKNHHLFKPKWTFEKYLKAFFSREN